MIYADWIEATGTQWIETGVPGDTPDLRTEIEYCPTAGYTSEYPVWGSIWEESGYFLMTYSNRWRFHIRGAVADDGTADTAYFSVISTTPNGFTVNGVQYSFGGSGEVSGNTITIFRIAHEPGTRANIYARGRLRRFRLWSGDTLLHDYRAALNDSDVPGLYDTVTETWLVNQGTGTFLYQLPYLYDKPSFLAGLAVGRMLWRPPTLRGGQDTGLGWAADPEYLVRDAGAFLGTSDERYFYKDVDGYAIAVYSAGGYMWGSGGPWYGPVLISTTKRFTDTTQGEEYTELDYLGLHWYVNHGWHYANATYTTPLITIPDYIGSIQDFARYVMALAHVRLTGGGA